MRSHVMAFVISFLMISAGLTFLAPRVSATAPTITAWGISPANAPIGTYVKCWLTYIDADNDAPTYVRCERSTLPSTAGLQLPVNTMVANNSGDTTYTDGKQYYFDWYFFPFANVGFIFFLVKSGAEAQVTKYVAEYQEPAPTLTHSGVSPMADTAGNYSFFTNFTDLFNGVPTYVRVVLDGSTFTMSKNNSTQTTWTTGVDYSYTANLTIGNHTYSFEALSLSGTSGKQSSGTYWVIIQPSPAHLLVSILSIPEMNTSINRTYIYDPLVSNSGNYTLAWSLTSNATGLTVNSSTGQVIGTVNTLGTYFVNLTAFDGVATVWQNWSLTVGADPTVTNANLVLALVFGFGLIILGFIDRKRAIWPVFAGFVWLVLSVVVLYQFGANQAEHILWMTIGIGIGLILMLEGAMAYASDRKQGAE